MPELTIASFNVHYGRGPRFGGFRPFDVTAACKDLDADVLVLQEVWLPDGSDELAEVAEALDMSVAVAAPIGRASLESHPRITGRDDGSGDGTSNLVLLSRLPVRSAEAVPLPHLRLDPVDRWVLSAEVDVEGRGLRVLGTHLPHLQMGSLTQRGDLRAILPASGPAVLVGDMNMWRWCIRWMAPRGWRNVVRGRTFPAHRPHSQIDHLLVTPEVEALAAGVAPEAGSDHRAIRARLRVRDRAATPSQDGRAAPVTRRVGR